MTQQDKDLLLRDLCARLPYKVFVMVEGYHIDKIKGIDGDVISTDRGINYPLRLVKPYLRPMSSMTEKECYQIANIRSTFTDNWKYIKTPIPLYIANYNQVDWLNAHHFDYRGLIEKGLAIAVTPENNPYNV